MVDTMQTTIGYNAIYLHLILMQCKGKINVVRTPRKWLINQKKYFLDTSIFSIFDNGKFMQTTIGVIAMLIHAFQPGD